MLALLALAPPLLLATIGAWYLSLGCCPARTSKFSSTRSASHNHTGSGSGRGSRKITVVDLENVNYDVKEARARKSREDEQSRKNRPAPEIRDHRREIKDQPPTDKETRSTRTGIVKVSAESSVRSVASTQFSTRSAQDARKSKTDASSKVMLLKNLLDTSTKSSRKRKKNEKRKETVTSKESGEELVESPNCSREVVVEPNASPVIRSSGEPTQKDSPNCSREAVVGANASPVTKTSAEATQKDSREAVIGANASPVTKTSAEATQKDSREAVGDAKCSPLNQSPANRGSGEASPADKGVQINKQPPSPSAIKSPPKPKTKKELQKEEEVRRWNAAIARGNLFRPRKDDETLDECQVDWNA